MNELIKSINKTTDNFIEKIDIDFLSTDTFFITYTKLKNLESAISEAVKNVESKVKEVIDQDVENNPTGKIESLYGKVTRTFDKIEVKKVFDTKCFQQEQPEMYEAYCTEQQKETKGKITITKNKLLEV